MAFGATAPETAETASRMIKAGIELHRKLNLNKNTKRKKQSAEPELIYSYLQT